MHPLTLNPKPEPPTSVVLDLELVRYGEVYDHEGPPHIDPQIVDSP